MVTRRDYTAEAVGAAKSVLIELVHLLGEYRNEIVLVGGWVPEILLGKPEAPHTGSMDIDLALDHRRLQEAGYRTIRKLLRDRGYREGPQPSTFLREVVAEDAKIVVQVDFMAGEYGGTGRSRRHQRVPEIQARKARGCDLAFTAPTELQVEGGLPGGGKDSVIVRVASIVPFLVMKGMALSDRLKEKDPWDIFYCVRHYPGGLDALAAEFRTHMRHGLESLYRTGHEVGEYANRVRSRRRSRTRCRTCGPSCARTCWIIAGRTPWASSGWWRSCGLWKGRAAVS